MLGVVLRLVGISGWLRMAWRRPGPSLARALGGEAASRCGAETARREEAVQKVREGPCRGRIRYRLGKIHSVVC